MKQIPWASVHDENHAKKHKKKMAYCLFIFRRIWVKEPRHSEIIFFTRKLPPLS